MPNPLRSRKRVRPPRRAADGSAFMNCDDCGGSVPVALMDMHECNVKKNVKKKLKENPKPLIIPKTNNISQQPGSPFVFFMESYAKSCKGRPLIEINREAFEKWKKMSTKEQWPYVCESRKVENAYLNVIHQEEIQLSQEGDDEADSAKCNKNGGYVNYDDYCSEDEEEPFNVWSCKRCPNALSCFCFDNIYF
ncbi:high mobility group B protein 7-like isoform X2 [Chenopodium quinoa]|uniref:high mobility group B protein 7-like isoform X2 n=1 Tax=Chenopodium quinoa TaxID=63459 RepID=UPI000B76BCEA|nr:high mobility group B protein 7-like isoform X2 [Chenopodium quinoa]